MLPVLGRVGERGGGDDGQTEGLGGEVLGAVREAEARVYSCVREGCCQWEGKRQE